MRDFATVILAAGEGTRMKSDLAKVLHPLDGRPMIHYVVELSLSLGAKRTIVVVGHQGERVKQALKGYPLEFAYQREQLGTGHAVFQTEPHLRNFDGDVLILYGDVPLLTKRTIWRLINLHWRSASAATLLTAELDDPSGYGRIIRNGVAYVERIVEDGDASEEERKVREVNTGTYIFQRAPLFSALTKITPDNKQGEYYLTDVIGVLRGEGFAVSALKTEDFDETRGVNTIEQLKMAEQILRRRKKPLTF